MLGSKLVSLRITRRPNASPARDPRSADLVADGPALHRDDRLMTITPVRCRCQACDVSGWDRREHAFDLNCRHVMAFVDHDVAVGADEVM